MMINYRAAHMESVAATASHMVKQMLERQPLSPAKVTFAYRVAAGPALAKAASAVWTAQSGVLTLHARGAAWCRELERASPVLRDRMTFFLGPNVVSKILVIEDPHA